mmetsp:Transcript_8552/g.16116  ORF Transcript_8552/g.16116 Transcript_8552/m.16116 type:complete len:589 (-) Transcript_8552:61-1827(-)
MNPTMIALKRDKDEQVKEGKVFTRECKAKCKISFPGEEGASSTMGPPCYSGAYRLEFQAFNRSNECFQGKMNLLSRPFYFVDAMLSLDSPEWDEVWYKDMGGKEKSMRVTVSLVDLHGNLIKHRKVPLKFTLLYDNESKSPVSNQKIFRILDDDSFQHHIDPKTGETFVKFRIDDVSKNHQGQNFILQVAAADDCCFGIVPAFSQSVCIRSKKRRNFNPNHGKRQKMNCEDTPQTMDHSSPRPEGDCTAGLNHYYDVQKLKEAIQSIIQWTEDVVNGLEPLKWKIIGYAQSQEGDIDYSRPFHNMINPNDKLDHILQMYSDKVQDHLRVLASTVEVIASSSPTDASYHHQPINANHDSSSFYPEHFYTTPHHYSPDQIYHKSTASQPTWHESSYRDYSNKGHYPHRGSVVSPQVLQENRSRDVGSSMTAFPNDSGSLSQQDGKNLTPTSILYSDATGTQIISHSNHDEYDQSDYTSAPEYLVQTDHVFYIFAKVFKSLKTDQVLGFPAYNDFKELIGFYKAMTLKSIGSVDFDPIERHYDEFGPEELSQAKQVLQDALSRQSKAVYALEDWDSLSSMVEHVSYSSNLK